MIWLLTMGPAALALGGVRPDCSLEPRIWGALALDPLVTGCVTHWFVNNADGFWFAGDAARLQAQIEGLVAAGIDVSLVVSPGDAPAATPFGTLDVAADWRLILTASGRRRSRVFEARIDAWSGGGLDPVALSLPVEVRTTIVEIR